MRPCLNECSCAKEKWKKNVNLMADELNILPRYGRLPIKEAPHLFSWTLGKFSEVILQNSANANLSLHTECLIHDFALWMTNFTEIFTRKK